MCGLIGKTVTFAEFEAYEHSGHTGMPDNNGVVLDRYAMNNLSYYLIEANGTLGSIKCDRVLSIVKDNVEVKQTSSSRKPNESIRYFYCVVLNTSKNRVISCKLTFEKYPSRNEIITAILQEPEVKSVKYKDCDMSVISIVEMTEQDYNNF